MLPITTPEAGIDAKDDCLVGVEPKPESVILFEIPEIEVGPPHRDFSRVVEQRALEAAPYFPAIFALRENRLRSAESIFPKPPQRVVAAQRRHQVEGHGGAGIGIRSRYEQAAGEHTASGEKPDVLAKIRVHTANRELARAEVVIGRRIDTIPTTLARVLGFSVINFQKRRRTHEVDRRTEALRRYRGEALFDRRHEAVLSLTESRTDILHAAARQER